MFEVVCILETFINQFNLGKLQVNSFFMGGMQISILQIAAGEFFKRLITIF